MIQSQGYTGETFWFDSILIQLHTKEVLFFLFFDFLVDFDGNITSKTQGFSFHGLTQDITECFS